MTTEYQKKFEELKSLCELYMIQEINLTVFVERLSELCEDVKIKLDEYDMDKKKNHLGRLAQTYLRTTR